MEKTGLNNRREQSCSNIMQCIQIKIKTSKLLQSNRIINLSHDSQIMVRNQLDTNYYAALTYFVPF